MSIDDDMKHRILYLVISQGGIDSEYRNVERARRRVQQLEREGTFSFIRELELRENGGPIMSGMRGSSWEILESKTGKLVCSLCEWSYVGVYSDVLTIITAQDIKDLFYQLISLEGTASERVREWCVQEEEDQHESVNQNRTKT